MHRYTKPVLGIFLLVICVAAAWLFYSPLPIFAHRIADCDRVVVKVNRGFPFTLTLTNGDAHRLIEAISAGRRERRAYEWAGLANVTIFRGTNAVETFPAGNGLFRLWGRQYRFNSSALDALVFAEEKWRFEAR
jgi:hypothetical protein